jgi:hypothetical protein
MCSCALEIAWAEAEKLSKAPMSLQSQTASLKATSNIRLINVQLVRIDVEVVADAEGCV